MFSPTGPGGREIAVTIGNLGTGFPYDHAVHGVTASQTESNEDRVKEADSQDQGGRGYGTAGGKSENEQ
jgi:hypothetical protein